MYLEFGEYICKTTHDTIGMIAPFRMYECTCTMSQATLGDLSGLEQYLAAGGEARKFDMVDGGEYDGDKACKF